MSKYDKETKFYWLQLKEDFFENDAIEWLEEQKPNGRDYAYFYLKLCLKSLKSNGVLIRKVGNVLIPYDNRKLAELTRMDFDTVTVAMELLQKIGLVTILESGEIYINQLDNLIGSQSKGAFQKQQQRLISRQLADKCPPKIEIKDRDRTKDIYNINAHFEQFWKAYPKKVSKQKCLKWFQSNKPNEQLLKTMLEQLERFKQTKDWQKNNGQFIPYPDTWLRNRRWEDEFETEEESEEAMIKRLEAKYENDSRGN